MTVFIHDDMHFASIAYSLGSDEYANDSFPVPNPGKLANILKKENIRSFNFLHGKRQKITPCVTAKWTNLNLSDLMRAILSYEEQASGREDFTQSEAGKLIDYFYHDLCRLSEGYEEADASGLTVADALLSFALHDDGDGMKSWHWDNDFNTFEESLTVNPGRIKPWPWLIATLTGKDKHGLRYKDAVIYEPVTIVKFLLENDGFADTPEANAIHEALLRHHVRRLEEVYGLPPKNIMSVQS